MKLQVKCMNNSCQKVIDVREVETHLKIFHPNFISLVRTTKIYDNIDRFKTPKEIVKLLFTEINKSGYSEGTHEI